MSSKVHSRAQRSPNWLNPQVISSTTKAYPNLWLKNLYLQMWIDRSQRTGVKLYKKAMNSKSKSKNIVKQGPFFTKMNFNGISVFSWHQVQPKFRVLSSRKKSFKKNNSINKLN